MATSTPAPPLLDRLIASAQPPDALMRPIVRAAVTGRLLRERAVQRRHRDPVESFAAARSRGPLAIETQAANDQHYEVPARFFELVLGPRLKYSSALFEPGTSSLAAAEEAMLDLTCRRAGVQDGMRLLDLGCGWGSLTLWLAERYPGASVTAVSNSSLQRRSIEARAARRGLDVEVVTADVNTLALDRRFDRVVSVEMFEHVRNHAALLRRVRDHLTDDGALFVHVFAHRARGYEFEDTWMTRTFFSGGVMPAHGWLGRVGDALHQQESWWLSGEHYARTAREWLRNFDANREEIVDVFAQRYGRDAAGARMREWRLFFVATEEIFAIRGGSEYGVSHTLLAPS